MADLHLVDDQTTEHARGKSVRFQHAPVDVAATEAAVLDHAISDMEAWITSLPLASEWRWSFSRARAGLVARRDELEDRVRTADQA